MYVSFGIGFWVVFDVFFFFDLGEYLFGGVFYVFFINFMLDFVFLLLLRIRFEYVVL